jgi:hypothetical protein
LIVNEAVEYLERDYDDLFLERPVEGIYEGDPPRYYSRRLSYEIIRETPGPHCRREMFETIDDTYSNCQQYTDTGPCSCGQIPNHVFSIPVADEELTQWFKWGVLPLYSHHTRDLMDQDRAWYHEARAADAAKAGKRAR